VLALTSCPECHAPAEITERFTLASTDGPVAHVAVSCLAGHHYRLPVGQLPGASSRRPALRLARLPHRFQVCVHCQVNPAGFWVMGKESSVVRRPWCLSCCQDLDQAACHVTPFAP